MKLIQDENGVTLVELLIAMFLFGMISMVAVNMYRAAMISWTKTSSQAQFTNNLLSTVQRLNVDVHEANNIIYARDKKIILAKGEKRIRYAVKETSQNVQIIREKKTENSKWEQDPKFPVADFAINGPANIPTINFNKLSPQQIHVEISLPGSKFQTIITSRSAL